VTAETIGTDVLGLLANVGDVTAALSDRARLQAMLDVEVALAEAEAALGIIPGRAAAAIRAEARADLYDLADLSLDASRNGNLAIPLVARLRSRVESADAQAATYVHWGATSQDVIDTALVLQMRAALPLVVSDLRRAARAAADHARREADTVMAGRTWLQHATPVTFGLKAAGWLDALGRACRRLQSSFDDAMVVQFGGASGTLAALGSEGPAVARALAARLSLRVPPLPWHGHRTRIAALAGDLGVAAGTVGKIARDLSLLAQTEVEEAFEPGAQAGGSSTMPHKRNPVRAALALACATRAPGLVATILGAMPHEHERGLGGWQAEWDAVPTLVLVSAAGARATASALEDLVVDPARMRANLARLGGLGQAEAVSLRLAPELGRTVAHAAVERAARTASSGGQSFADALAADASIAGVLARGEIERLLTPEAYLGATRAFIEATLAEWKGEMEIEYGKSEH
jgi:3-carboxy-cis,cis-muconate cycloisomerase